MTWFYLFIKNSHNKEKNINNKVIIKISISFTFQVLVYVFVKLHVPFIWLCKRENIIKDYFVWNRLKIFNKILHLDHPSQCIIYLGESTL